MALKTPEQRRAAKLRRKAKDPENYFTKRKEQKRRSRVRKRGGPPRAPSLYDRLGWSQEMFDATLAEQGNACALCRKPFTAEAPPVRDHKHGRPPEPRGLLHSHCNSLIGFAKDDPEICRAAAEYLEAWT